MSALASSSPASAMRSCWAIMAWMSGLFSALRLDGLPPRDAVGHEKATMTYRLYSGGVSLAVKRDALAKLAY